MEVVSFYSLLDEPMQPFELFRVDLSSHLAMMMMMTTTTYLLWRMLTTVRTSQYYSIHHHCYHLNSVLSRQMHQTFSALAVLSYQQVVDISHYYYYYYYCQQVNLPTTVWGVDRNNIHRARPSG